MNFLKDLTTRGHATIGGDLRIAWPNDNTYTLTGRITNVDFGGGFYYTADLLLKDGAEAVFLTVAKGIGGKSCVALPMGTWDFTSATAVYGLTDYADAIALARGLAF